jgi:hypothetical protein
LSFVEYVDHVSFGLVHVPFCDERAFFEDDDAVPGLCEFGCDDTATCAAADDDDIAVEVFFLVGRLDGIGVAFGVWEGTFVADGGPEWVGVSSGGAVCHEHDELA